MDARGIYIHGLFTALALTTALWVRFSSTHFKVSTLDVLILLVALTVPNLQGLGLKQLGIVALESIVLLRHRSRDAGTRAPLGHAADRCPGVPRRARAQGSLRLSADG